MTGPSTVRHAFHEAGHAVAAVARGGWVQEIRLAGDEEGDIGYVKHWSSPKSAAFVTYAGVWSEAKWDTITDPDTDMDQALDLAWAENGDGDTDKYHGIVDQLQESADELGLGSVGCAWENDWHDELDELWPWIRTVAAQLLNGVEMSHERIAAAKERADRAVRKVRHVRPAAVANKAPELLTRAAAARLLGVAPRTVTRLITEGQLRTETVAGKIVIRPEWIAEARAAGLGGRGDHAVPAGMLTVTQAAARAGVAENRIRAAIETGRLAAHRGGTNKRTVYGVKVSDLSEWAAERVA